MSDRTEYFKCKVCTKQFAAVFKDGLVCPRCGTIEIKGIKKGLKFDVV